jgi:FkbM family methyltransferase
LDFSTISNASLLGKILRFPLRLIPAQSVVRIMQGKLRGTRWIVGSSTHACWLGTYEFDKRLAFEAAVTDGSVVLDVGAHVGYYTLLASVVVGPGGKVFAFEPLHGNRRYLQRHLRLNNIENVTVIDAAVSNHTGVAWFQEGQTSSTGRIAPDGALQIRTVALDDLVARGEIPLPSHIKIDIEGAEVAALLGARSILQMSHPTLFIATHSRDIHQQCCDFLRSLDYRLEAIDGRRLEECRELLAR